ncbi:hypothetical protein [Pontibacter pamirensis]|uniref:hypothetical protein n=1 Tax=Pontibacter pamirensis TaxID=2562824 RepID=UPI00138985A3|nr:hypothetical protein [Pontibacter pamirensis]
MKIIVLLFALLVGVCFACKTTFDQRELLAQRQQLLANAAVQESPTQPQATATI